MWLMIYKQLINRWRSNLSVCVELFLVFCLTWYLLDYFFIELYNRSLPTGRSYDDVWLVEMGVMPENSREYVAIESDSLHILNNYHRVLDRLRSYPGVKHVGASFGCSSLPYSQCFMGDAFRSVDDTSRVASCMEMMFDPSTEFLEVFSHKDGHDGSLVSTASYDWGNPNAILITRRMEQALFDGQSAVGKMIISTYNSDENKAKQIVGVLQDVKRHDNSLPGAVMISPIRIEYVHIPQMYYFIRVDRTESDGHFADEFMKQMSSELRIGNFYLKRITPYFRYKSDIDFSFGVTYNYRVRLSLLLFLSVNILLCVVGTFWYRVRLRRGEIGLRMALGSSRGEIRGMLIREGITMLLLVTPFAMLLESQFMLVGLVDLPYTSQTILPDHYLPANMVLRFLIVNLAVWFTLALSIVFGVWLPANRAASLEPAEALHYE